jgi:tRNA A-37 threonylcarbamoyl transferase component Bud32
MSDLVVKSQCNSPVRQALETTLNALFPVWGVLTPLAIVGLIMSAVGHLHECEYGEIAKLLVGAALALCFAVTCLMLKRMAANDFLIVDTQGIRLPRMLGACFNLTNYVGWNGIAALKASVCASDPLKSVVSIVRKKGSNISIPINKLSPEFSEQLLLAARMWAPDICDPSLDELQDALRSGARDGDGKSYTEMWENELGRRFCPTAYIPLSPGRFMRDNTLKIISHLASGGLSALYLCQLDGKQLVVLKEAVIPQQGTESVREKAREMFEREAQLLMKLDHKNIVKVLECFSENERNYLLLEYIDGIDLRQLVKQNGPQKESDVLEWATQLASSLKYMHEREQPIIHRDFTPDNMVLRNDGQVVLVDFGAANEFIGTATGTFVGKQAFISPEQLRGKATVHSDIYAFGCTLFFLLTGQEPEALSSSNPKELNPAVSDELCELIESCTQMETADRYQSVAQLLPVLRRLSAVAV